MRRPEMRPLVCALAVLTSACATVRVPPAPLRPQQAIAEFDARTLDSANLRDFMRAALNEPVAWPPAEWDLNSLTLAALYYHPDLDVARAGWREGDRARREGRLFGTVF